MAVTKTHPIKSTLKAAIDYILNPEKTDGKLLHLLVDQPLFFFRNVKLHLYISLSVFHFRTAFRYKGLGLSQQAFSANGYSFAVLAIYSIPLPKGDICCVLS